MSAPKADALPLGDAPKRRVDGPSGRGQLRRNALALESRTGLSIERVGAVVERAICCFIPNVEPNRSFVSCLKLYTTDAVLGFSERERPDAGADPPIRLPSSLDVNSGWLADG